MMLMPILMLLATTVNLPPGCHMVAEDSNMLGGVRVGAASLGACCRACDGSCQRWQLPAVDMGKRYVQG